MSKKKGKSGVGREERLRLEAEMARENFRNKLRQELEMGETNIKKLRNAWRKKMTTLNLPVLKEDIQVAWRYFDRALDSKDYCISVLLDALHIADEQQKQADAGHMERIDRLLQLHKGQLLDNETFYNDRVKFALDTIRGQMDRMQDEQTENEHFLRALTYGTKKKYDDSIDIINTQNMSKLDTRKEENENMRRFAKTLLKRRLRKYTDMHGAIIREHEENTKDLRKKYDKLKKKDDEDQRVIAWQSIRIVQLYQVMQALRKQILDFRTKADKELGDYRFENNFFHTSYSTIEKRFQEEYILDKEQLKTFVVEYNTTIQSLEECNSKVEKMIIMVELCEKYETFEDKIRLRPFSVLPVNEENAINKNIILPIKKFMKLISQVENEVDKLKDRLENLGKESRSFIHLLKQIIEQFSEPPPLQIEKNLNSKPLIINVKDLIK